MPELPEVETIVRELNNHLPGKKILSIDVLRKSTIVRDIELFKNNLTGKVIKSIHRQGKYLLFECDKDCWMMAHLRMTGKFIFQNHSIGHHPHNRTVFQLSGKSHLIFNDVRCFGTLEFVSELKNHPKLKLLGWDPWDKKLTSKKLKEQLNKRKASIKSLLLNQSIIAGLGNIYAAEILFDACIRPDTTGANITVDQAKRIIKSMRFILSEALKYNGTSISDFRRVDDKQGTFQNFLKVYGKEKQPCIKCSSPIIRIIQNQRSTFYCEKCQK